MVESAQPGYHPTFPRRRILEAIPSLLASLALACGKKAPSEPKVTTTPEDDSTTIINEAVRLGTKVDPQEQRIWQNAYQRSQRGQPITEESSYIISEYIAQTIENMASSKNEYFLKAVTTIANLNDIGLLNVTVNRTVTVANHESYSAIETVIDENKIKQNLVLSGERVLNDTSGLLLAIILTHEAKHLEERVTFQNSLPANTSLQDRIQLQSQKAIADRVTSEANAYAVQSEAIIESVRLGVGAFLPGDVLNVAAEYIRTGRNPNSEAWRQFIAKRLNR